MNKKNEYSLKKLTKNFLLYGSKNKKIGFNILDYTKKNEKNKKEHCIYENISWFARLEQAKHYKGKDDEIFKWHITEKINLIKITDKNKHFFQNLFLSTTIKIKPVINIKSNIKKIDYEHSFLKMNNKEKALYEFEFIFGYISLKEQYEFLLLIKYLIQNNFIDVMSRKNISLLPKINQKIYFYKLYPFGKKEKLNRISLYQLNKNSVLNVCKLVNKKYEIDGIYQPNNNSYWFPNIGIYHMNIEEFILFSPHTKLINGGIV